MGSSQSNTKKEADPADALVPSVVFERLKNLQDILTGFTDNDPKFISKYIQQYNNDARSSGLQLDMAKIQPQLSRIDNLHTQLIRQITNDATITSQQLSSSDNYQNQLKNALKDTPKLINTRLPEVTKGLITKEIEALQNDNLIKKDPVVQGTVNSILSSIIGLKSRYSFFEYKYVQMNVLVMVIIQNLYNIMITSIKNIIDLHTKQSKQRDEDLNNILKLILSLLNSSQLSITPEDFDKINLLVNNVKEKSIRDAESLKQIAKDSIQNANTQTQSALTSVQIQSQSPTPSSAQTPVTMYAATQEGKGPEMTTMYAGLLDNNKKQKGGFVRGNSSFPVQEFYNL
jgi:hypothetical protein